MKKLNLLLVAVCALFLGSFSTATAQQTVCTIDPQYVEPGLYPEPDSLDCLIQGEYNDITVQFVNFDSTTAAGVRVKVEYIIIDSVLNLPCGITWSTSAQDAPTKHRFENQERGCIRFWGTSSDAVGQYRLKILVKAKVSLLPAAIDYDADDLGFRVDVRMTLPAGVCPDIDTTSGATLQTASCTTVDTRWTGIANISSIEGMSFFPNPTTGVASVSFNANKAATYTARIINIFGQEVTNEVLNVTTGFNVNKVDVSNLAAGVYISTITDGKNVQTQRFVVEK